jgi:hypothetical protein
MKKIILVLLMTFIPALGKATFLVGAKPTMVAWPTPQVTQQWMINAGQLFFWNGNKYVEVCSVNYTASGPITIQALTGNIVFAPSGSGLVQIDSNGNILMGGASVSFCGNMEAAKYGVGATPTPGASGNFSGIQVSSGLITGPAATYTPTITPTATNTPTPSLTRIIPFTGSNGKNLYDSTTGLFSDTNPAFFDQLEYSQDGFGHGQVFSPFGIYFGQKSNDSFYFDGTNIIANAGNLIMLMPIQLSGNPTTNSQASNKLYTDTHIQGSVVTPVPTYKPYSGAITIDAGIAATPIIANVINGLIVVQTPEP